MLGRDMDHPIILLGDTFHGTNQPLCRPEAAWQEGAFIAVVQTKFSPSETGHSSAKCVLAL